MRKIALFLILCLWMPLASIAQQSSGWTPDLTATSTVTAPATPFITSNGAATVTVNATGTGSGMTWTVQGSNDGGITWQTIAGYDLVGGSGVTSFSANGVYRFSSAGFQTVRVNLTAISSGSETFALSASTRPVSRATTGGGGSVTGVAPIVVTGSVVSITKATNSALGSGQCDGTSTTCANGVISGQTPINAQTGTSYTFLSSDCAELVTFTNASAVAATLPAASAMGFTASCKISVHNYGAGTVSITPNAPSNIGLLTGQATFTMPSGYDCSFTSDSANWQLSACTASLPSTTPYSAKVGATVTATIGSPVAAIAFTNLTGTTPYILNCYNITTASATNMQILFSENNGSTYLSANYTYRFIGRSNTAAISGNSASASSIVITDNTLPANSVLPGSPYLPFNISATLNNLSSTTIYKDVFGQDDYSNTVPASVMISFGASYIGDAAAINAIELKPAAGNMAGSCTLGALN